MAKRDSSGRFTFDTDTLTGRLKVLFPRIREASAAAFQYHANIAESIMRQNASWTDRTANARNGLRATYVPSELVDALVLYHTVPYGVWLELAFSGRYAIIVPTMQRQAIELGTTIAQLLNRLGGV